MKYIISANLAELQEINAKIHQYMIDNILDYNAEKWADIYEHPIEKLYALPIKDTDKRSPLNALNLDEKNKIADTIPEDWLVSGSRPNVKEFRKVEIL